MTTLDHQPLQPAALSRLMLLPQLTGYACCSANHLDFAIAWLTRAKMCEHIGRLKAEQIKINTHSAMKPTLITRRDTLADVALDFN